MRRRRLARGIPKTVRTASNFAYNPNWTFVPALRGKVINAGPRRATS
jgi:hypothetical protein